MTRRFAKYGARGEFNLLLPFGIQKLKGFSHKELCPQTRGSAPGASASDPVIGSRSAFACNFMSCFLSVLHFRVLQFHALQFGRSFSCLSFSAPPSTPFRQHPRLCSCSSSVKSFIYKLKAYNTAGHCETSLLISALWLTLSKAILALSALHSPISKYGARGEFTASVWHAKAESIVLYSNLQLTVPYI